MAISINLKTTETLSIAIYHDFNKIGSGNIIPVAGSKLVSGTISNGNFSGIIRITGSMSSILIQLFSHNGNTLFYQSVEATNPSGISITGEAP
ncbi:hypothetical protein C0W27_03325 [Photobacterium angustum]|uniref:Uncharacterized protein n=2 Tax=Photobacterium angustum TaxID=661 RepID=A0ABX5H975_PHOAN|nr:hypothetical protein C0W27_03325 [Photobacterium angustum]